MGSRKLMTNKFGPRVVRRDVDDSDLGGRDRNSGNKRGRHRDGVASYEGSWSTAPTAMREGVRRIVENLRQSTLRWKRDWEEYADFNDFDDGKPCDEGEVLARAYCNDAQTRGDRSGLH